MSDPAAVDAYRNAFANAGGRAITFRRVNGNAPRTATFDATVIAIFRAYQPTSPIGESSERNAAITQGLREFIVLEDDLKDKRFPLPLKKDDKIIADGETFNISEVDPGTRAYAGAIEGKAAGV